MRAMFKVAWWVGKSVSNNVCEISYACLAIGQRSDSGTFLQCSIWNASQSTGIDRVKGSQLIMICVKVGSKDVKPERLKECRMVITRQ